MADPDAEIEVYRRWWGERRVDGVFVCDLRIDDTRVPALEELHLPAVVIGGPAAHGALPSVWSDDAGAMAETVEYLAALGHRRIARVGGPARPAAHRAPQPTPSRRSAGRLGLDRAVTVAIRLHRRGGRPGHPAAAQLGAARPTAIIYDNDVMAVAGLSVAQEMGLDRARRPVHRGLGRLGRCASSSTRR